MWELNLRLLLARQASLSAVGRSDSLTLPLACPHWLLVLLKHISLWIFKLLSISAGVLAVRAKASYT